MNLQLLLNPGPQPLALLVEDTESSVSVRDILDKEPQKLFDPSSTSTLEQQAVDVLFGVLSRKEPANKALGLATQILWRAGFGLVVFKHPRPGVVHAYNKKFGGRPICQPDTLDIRVLYTAMARGEII